MEKDAVRLESWKEGKLSYNHEIETAVAALVAIVNLVTLFQHDAITKLPHFLKNIYSKASCSIKIFIEICRLIIQNKC